MADKGEVRVVPAVHGARKIELDAAFELDLTDHLRDHYGRDQLIELIGHYSTGNGVLDGLMRRALWRAVARPFGQGVHIGIGVGFKHLETFEIGDGVLVGDHAYIQGRHDGVCVIGNHVWLGPQSYLDARNLVIEDHVGWGPGAKVLGSTHTGLPPDVPIIETGLEIRPVRVQSEADIGTNATLLPGVTIGRGAIVGAGAVVTKDVPPFAIVVGVPARLLRWRKPPEESIETDTE